MNTFNLDQKMSEAKEDRISAEDRAIILHAIKVALESTNNPEEIAVYKQTAATIRKMQTK